ncbi:MAG: nucleotidyltransferase family protein [Pseudomonadales bacterium]
MIGAIVLGAGSSRRFGDDKRKARLPDGRLVIEQTTANALAAFEAVLLVLRADDQAFKAQLADSLGSEHLRIILAPDSALGMGHSLANAVTAVGHWQGAFICLGDMPYLTQATLRQPERSSVQVSEQAMMPVSKPSVEQVRPPVRRPSHSSSGSSRSLPQLVQPLVS